MLGAKCSWSFLWAASSQITTPRLLINYGRFVFSSGLSQQALITKINPFTLIYIMPRGSLSHLHTVHPISSTSYFLHTLHLSKVLSVTKSHLYLLPSHWLFGFLLHQSHDASSTSVQISHHINKIVFTM